MQPSSADLGFFQQPPILRNQVRDDPMFLPPSLLAQVEPELVALADKVLSADVFDAITDAERNVPYLRGSGRDAFGQPRNDTLVVTQGWKDLQSFGIKNGIVAYNYDQDHAQYTRVVQLLRAMIWEPSCGSGMTDGAARLLQRQLAIPDLDSIQRNVFQNAYDHLISRDPDFAWTSGQWMTERPGGSDVSKTETVAAFTPFAEKTAPLANVKDGMPLGPWSINGFKWFSSATDSSMTILLAKTGPDKGVSAFFAPMRRYNPSLLSHTGERGGTELNGVRISRLKDKMGTKPLPTAELELNDMRAWLIGHEGKGIREIATVLTITRVHSVVAALGYLGRGLAVAKAFTLVREIGATRGRRLPLRASPLHMRTLAAMTTEYRAMMLLNFYTAYLLGLDDERAGAPLLRALTAPPPRHVAPLLRVLGSLNKAYCCKQAIPLFYGCMEALGGVGYLNNAESEHLNLSRLFRDLCVLATWEGTTDVLATDMLRALKHPREGKASLEALDWFMRSNKPAPRALEEWRRTKARLERETQDELIADARGICFRLAEILMAALLAVDAGSDGDATAAAVLGLFLDKVGFGEAGVEKSVTRSTLETDTAIVFGKEAVKDPKAGPKL